MPVLFAENLVLVHVLSDEVWLEPVKEMVMLVLAIVFAEELLAEDD